MKAAALLLCAWVVNGCALYADRQSAADWPTIYHRAGADAAQLERDGTECYWEPKTDGQKAAAAAMSLLFLAPTPQSASEHAACMKAKGYTVTR